jgi:hypothetical protein
LASGRLESTPINPMQELTLSQRGINVKEFRIFATRKTHTLIILSRINGIISESGGIAVF